MNRYHISGPKPHLDKFFEVSREISLILSSWPYKGDAKEGFCIQLSPTLPHASFLMHAIAEACELGCDTLEHSMEADLKQCKDFLKFILCAVEKGHLTCTGMDVQRLRELTK